MSELIDAVSDLGQTAIVSQMKALTREGQYMELRRNMEHYHYLLTGTSIDLSEWSDKKLDTEIQKFIRELMLRP